VGIRTITIGLGVVFALCLIIPLGYLPLTLVLGGFIGLVNVPILPSSYALVAKLTPGMAPAVVNGLMMSGAQIFAFLASLIMTGLLNYGQRYGIGFFLITQLIACVCVCCIDERKSAGSFLAKNGGEVDGLSYRSGSIEAGGQDLDE